MLVQWEVRLASFAAVTWTRDLGRPHRVSCAFTDMREASRRLSQSLFDAYDPSWVGEEDLGAIVEVSKLTWAAADMEKKNLNRRCGCRHSW